MTRLIDIPAIRQLLRHDGLEQTLAGLRHAIAEDFGRWEDFDKSPRLATHYPWGVIELMPISDASLYAFKYVNGHPNNPKAGKASVVALGVLADVETGYPLLVSEMTVLTALRTAATSALVAQYCALAESERMAMIGIGVQAAFQAVAIAGVLPLTELRCYDIQPARIQHLRANLAPYGLRVQGCNSIAEALDSADLVTTATAAKRHQRLLTPDSVRAGMHINAIGGDCPGKTELDPCLIEAARVIVEYEPQTRVEGELQLARPDLPVTELWELSSGRAAGRRARDEITLFDSVGFALEDFSVLRYVRDRADALGLGYQSALVPDTAESADLFASVAGGGAPLWPSTGTGRGG